LPPVTGGGAAAAGGVGDGDALGACASAGAPEAVIKTNDEADRKRLRLKRMDWMWFTKKIPDSDDHMRGG
jgi:hypothetical protein